MNLAFAPERTKGAVELDPMVEFRQGVELLKNENPQKPSVSLRRAFECEKHNLTTGYPEVFDLKKEVLNENAEKSSGYIVCSVVRLSGREF